MQQISSVASHHAFTRAPPNAQHQRSGRTQNRCSRLLRVVRVWIVENALCWQKHHVCGVACEGYSVWSIDSNITFVVLLVNECGQTHHVCGVACEGYSRLFMTVSFVECIGHLHIIKCDR